MKSVLLIIAICFWGVCTHAQLNRHYFDYKGNEIKLSNRESSLRLPKNFNPVMDYPIRDVSICLGPDSTYYMTGTTGFPDWWAVTGDIQIWKSKNLVDWVPIIQHPRKRTVVWNVDRNGSWEKKVQLRDSVPFRPLWAPEIHYFNDTFWLVYSIPRLGNGILKSTSGKAEGPYEKVLAKDGPLTADIDASLFKDDDGQLYFVCGEGKIIPMKSDLSAPLDTPRLLKPANALHVGFEGAFLFKHQGLYYLSAAEFVNGSYHAFVAWSKDIYGPYSERKLCVPHGGHNTFFKDVEGRWWSTFFGNDAQSPFKERAGILGVHIKNGEVQLDSNRFSGNESRKDRAELGDVLQQLHSPILLKGNNREAFRDPAVLLKGDTIFLYFSYMEIADDGKIHAYTAMTYSQDLKEWSEMKILTPRDQSLNFSSPGNIIQYKNEWIMCLQTYPRPDYHVSEMPRYGNKDSRIYCMRSKDLINWSEPELLHVKGNDVKPKNMGRMIDPYFLEDKDEAGKWWVFYKQNGMSMSYTYDFKNWTYAGKVDAGENACVIVDDNQYWLFHSPENGIGIKRTKDLKDWTDIGEVITLGQQNWLWARGRITAACVIDARSNSNFKRYLMFFHGSGPLTEKEGDFDKNSSIGIAWSDDLFHWEFIQ